MLLVAARAGTVSLDDAGHCYHCAEPVEPDAPREESRDRIRRAKMPIYEYQCEECGPFTRTRAMSMSAEPANCPGCNCAAARAFLTPPRVMGMDRARRSARSGRPARRRWWRGARGRRGAREAWEAPHGNEGRFTRAPGRRNHFRRRPPGARAKRGAAKLLTYLLIALGTFFLIT